MSKLHKLDTIIKLKLFIDTPFLYNTINGSYVAEFSSSVGYMPSCTPKSVVLNTILAEIFKNGYLKHVTQPMLFTLDSLNTCLSFCSSRTLTRYSDEVYIKEFAANLLKAILKEREANPEARWDDIFYENTFGNSETEITFSNHISKKIKIIESGIAAYSKAYISLWWGNYATRLATSFDKQELEDQVLYIVAKYSDVDKVYDFKNKGCASVFSICNANLNNLQDVLLVIEIPLYNRPARSSTPMPFTIQALLNQQRFFYLSYRSC